MKDSDYNIASVLSAVARNQPDQPAIIAKFRRRFRTWNFSQVEETVNSFVDALLRADIKSGDRVMLMVRPSLNFICLTFALFRLGAVVILIDPGMGYKNLLRCIASVCPKVLVGIPQALILKKIFPAAFKSIDTEICVGFSPFGVLGRRLQDLVGNLDTDQRSGEKFTAKKDDLAAIIFTTGSTGPPKGVQYTHGVFHAQLALIRDYYKISAADIDQPAFPLFALFTTAMGACAVVPDMNPAHPAKVNPARFVASINKFKVSYSFGSPAIWNVVSKYCLKKKITLPSLKKILMAGAPVTGELVQRLRQIMPPSGEIHTPYGATESLPIASISGSQIVDETWPLTKKGAGTCVGKPLPSAEIKIIKFVDGPINTFAEVEILAPRTIGEIIVTGPMVTRAYDHNDNENSLAKIMDSNDRFWHRLGDMGYFDGENRLWFCGRKAHRVLVGDDIYYTIPCEALFNEHPKIYRSALVGAKLPGGGILPVVIVEPYKKVADSEVLITELQKIAINNTLTSKIEHFLIHPSFPVDIRHNAKIFREKLAVWATSEITGAD